MKNLVSSVLLTSETETISLNTDILETNLINIIILLILLINVLGNFLSNSLETRQKNIVNNIQDGEKRLNEANQRLNEAKAQWSQAQIIIQEIKTQTEKAKTSLLELEFDRATQSLAQMYKNTSSLLSFAERKLLLDITKRVATLAFEKVVSKLEKDTDEKKQGLIIDSKINQLGGYL